MLLRNLQGGHFYWDTVYYGSLATQHIFAEKAHNASGRIALVCQLSCYDRCDWHFWDTSFIAISVF